MEDHPVYDGSSFVNDERFKVGGFSSQSYPYTVEFEEEDEMTEMIVYMTGTPRHPSRDQLKKVYTE